MDNVPAKLQPAYVQFKRLGETRRKLHSYISGCQKTHGETGHLMSGGGFSGWPKDKLQRIRDLNNAINAYDDAGLAMRPSRMRTHTFLKFRRIVIGEFE